MAYKSLGMNEQTQVKTSRSILYINFLFVSLLFVAFRNARVSSRSFYWHSFQQSFPRNQNFTLQGQFQPRFVPANTSCFNYPWRLPTRVKLSSLAESKNRMLLSTVPNYVPRVGLGHAMLMINAKVSTAIRMNLTYLHSTSKYDISTWYETHYDFHQAAVVEQFFGWGVGEMPREVVKPEYCTFESNNLSLKCLYCNRSRPALSKRSHGNEALQQSCQHIRAPSFLRTTINT